MSIRRARVAEAIAAEYLGDFLVRRIGIQYEVDFRLRRGIFAEGIVQQVIENFAVQFRSFAILGLKRIERRPLR